MGVPGGSAGARLCFLSQFQIMFEVRLVLLCVLGAVAHLRCAHGACGLRAFAASVALRLWLCCASALRAWRVRPFCIRCFALRAWRVQPSCIQRPRVQCPRAQWSESAFAVRWFMPHSCRPSSPPTPTTSSSAASSPSRARTPTASPGKLRLPLGQWRFPLGVVVGVGGDKGRAPGAG